MKTLAWSPNHSEAVVRGWVSPQMAAGATSLTVEFLDASGAVTSVGILRVAQLADNGSGDVSLYPSITGTGLGSLAFSAQETDLVSPDSAGAVYLIDDLATATIPTVRIVASHTPGDLAEMGLDLDVGTDAVGLWMSEKDSGTVQLYPDNAGGYDIELVDRGSGKYWKSVSSAYTTPLAGIPHLYRLPFAWNTASISTGVAIGAVKATDLILGAWIDVATAWNSTVSDVGDIVTATNGESLMGGTVSMQSVGAGTDRRKLRDGALFSGEQSIMRTDQTINVKVTSTGISLSAGAATAFVLVVPTY